MGSRKGIPNKDKTQLLRALQKIHPEYNPLSELLKIAMDEDTSLSEQIVCHKEIAQYVHPKLKAIEHSGETQHNHTILSREEMKARIQAFKDSNA